MKNMTSENRALALMYGYNATNEMHWNHLWKIYSTSEVDADRKIVMRAFAQFRDHDKINLYVINLIVFSFFISFKIIFVLYI